MATAKAMRKRLETIRRPDVRNDQLDPSAIAADASSNDESLDDYVSRVLSQLKRILHGGDSGNWDDDVATVFGTDASLKNLLSSSGSVVPDKLRSNTGEFTVPASVNVRDLVYVTGALAADQADANDIARGPVYAIVLDKPTSTTATLALGGKIPGFTGLTPGAALFVGTGGAVVSPPLSATGYAQRVGVAISSTTIVFTPSQSIHL